MRIRNLFGVISGQGFIKKNGRRVDLNDLGWIAGPVDIKILDGKIQSIEAAVSPNHEPDSNDVDGTGLIASSGFFESHSHPVFFGSRAWEYFERWQGQSYQNIAARGGGIKSTFEKTQAADDSLLSQMTSKHFHDSRQWGVVMNEAKSGYGSSPNEEQRLLRLLSSLKTKFHLKTTFLGLHAIPQGETGTGWTDKMISLLPILKQEGLIDFVDAFPELGFFSLENSVRFVEAAAVIGVRSKIHCDELSPMNSSLTFAKLGAVSVDHLQKISPEAIHTLSQVPTVGTLLPATSFYLNLEYAPARRMLDAGVQVALATDFNPGTAPNLSPQFTGLLAASQLKMRPEEIWCALTFNGAAALGESQNYGALTPGRSCAVALWKTLSKNPIEAIAEILVEQIKPERLCT